MPQDDAKAVEWYRKAAEQELAVGQFNLAVMYETGRGVPKDLAEARAWHLKAALQGLVPAQVRLAQLLCAGDGLPKDNVEAYKWLEVAASKESPAAAKERDSLAERMSPEQIACARELAKRFQPKPSPASSLWIEEPLDSR